jgi:hypothetical protein
LFSADRCLQDAAFVSDLWSLELANPRFHFVSTFTRMADDSGGWKGKTGPISSEMLLRKQQTHADRSLRSSPPPMVAAVRYALCEAGMDEDDIRAAEFAGY